MIPPHKAQMIICSKHFGGHGPYVPSDYAHACRQRADMSELQAPLLALHDTRTMNLAHVACTCRTGK